MGRSFGRDVIHRYEKNPILNLEDMAFTCLNIMNAGAVKYKNEIILMVRVETMKGHSILVLARSSNGINFTLDKEPIMIPSEKGEFAKFEEQGIGDPRITLIDGTYYIMYTAISRYGRRLALAKTKDFKKIERISLITEPDNHSGALFPKKIDGDFVRLDRPREGGNMWISYSKDLIKWGRSEVSISPRGDGYWDAHRIGCAVPPIETDKGWLIVYYGEKDTSAGPIFRMGTIIVEKKNITKVIGRSRTPILSPREYYERVGDSNNMVFSCGAIVDEAKDELMLYYGGASMGINLGTAHISEVVEECLKGE